jgi:hypothetical protein
VEVVDAAAALVVALVAGRAGWEAGPLPDRVEIASVPTAGIGSRTRLANPVTRKSAKCGTQMTRG